jgi:streptogramin lyase
VVLAFAAALAAVMPAAAARGDVDGPYLNVWVHYDYMVGPGYSDAPSPAAINMVVDAFKAHGVTLHIDPQHTAIPARRVIVPDWHSAYASSPGFDDPSCTGPDAVRFSDLRNQYFNPSSNHPWHYAVFGDYVIGDPHVSPDGQPYTDHCPKTGGEKPAPGMLGASQVGFLDVPDGLGYSFVVAMQPFRDVGRSATDVNEAALFMHELGHNLGLCHGGPNLPGTDCPQGNFKPNYLSVMNYDFELGIPYAATPGSTTIAGWRVDYSDVQLPDLDEQGCLNESVGLQDTVHPTDITYAGGTFYPVLGPVDWNHDGNTTDTCLAIDLNSDQLKNTLQGADDWAWLHSRLTPPAITSLSLDKHVLTVSGVNLIGPPRVFFSGGVEAAVHDFHYDLSPETSFQVDVPVGAKSGPVTVVTPEGKLVSSQSVTIVGHATGSGDIAAGPDGDMWFTEPDGNGIGRISADGTITQFPLPTLGDPYGITAGPDGNIWFTEPDTNAIGRITPGGSVTTFPVPTPASRPFGITAGPDGNLWFTEEASGKIGRITPDGTITEFLGPIYTLDGWVTLHPHAIATARGELWFTADSPITEPFYDTTTGKTTTLHMDLGSLDPSGNNFSLFGTRTPVYSIAVYPDAAFPLAENAMDLNDSTGVMSTSALALNDFEYLLIEEEIETPVLPPPPGYFAVTFSGGPNGSGWFLDYPAGVIVCMCLTPGTEYSLPTVTPTQFTLPAVAPDETGSIAAAPDGNVWFTEDSAQQVGRITPNGQITEFPLP